MPKSQNIYFATGKALSARSALDGEPAKKAAAEWTRAFKSLGQLLRVDPSIFLPSARGD